MSLEEKINDIINVTAENGVIEFLAGQQYEWSILALDPNLPEDTFSLIAEINWLEQKLLDAYEVLLEKAKERK